MAKPSPKDENSKDPKKAKAKPKGKYGPNFAELPPAIDIRNVGRPSKYETYFCELVIELGAEGKSYVEMAAAIGVARDTLNEWRKTHHEFSVACTRAKELSLAWWIRTGQVNMVKAGFNAQAYQFMMRNLFPEDIASDRVELTGKGGKDLIPETPRDPMELARWIELKMTIGARAPVLIEKGNSHDD